MKSEDLEKILEKTESFKIDFPEVYESLKDGIEEIKQQAQLLKIVESVKIDKKVN